MGWGGGGDAPDLFLFLCSAARAREHSTKKDARYVKAAKGCWLIPFLHFECRGEAEPGA